MTDLAAITDRAERDQSWQLGTVPPPRPAELVSWSPPPPCEAQRAPLEDCGHAATIELVLAVGMDAATVTEHRRVKVCETHRHPAEVVLLAYVPRNRVVTLTALPIETVKGLTP